VTSFLMTRDILYMIDSEDITCIVCL